MGTLQPKIFLLNRRNFWVWMISLWLFCPDWSKENTLNTRYSPSTNRRLELGGKRRDQYWTFMVESRDIPAYLSVSVDCVTLIGISFTNVQRFQPNRFFFFHDSTGLWLIIVHPRWSPNSGGPGLQEKFPSRAKTGQTNSQNGPLGKNSAGMDGGSPLFLLRGLNALY